MSALSIVTGEIDLSDFSAAKSNGFAAKRNTLKNKKFNDHDLRKSVLRKSDSIDNIKGLS
jgi:hypothetical protein